jgi:hypothetical protein
MQKKTDVMQLSYIHLRKPNVMVAYLRAGEALYSKFIIQLYNASPARRQATVTLGCLCIHLDFVHLLYMARFERNLWRGVPLGTLTPCSILKAHSESGGSFGQSCKTHSNFLRVKFTVVPIEVLLKY